MRRTLKSLHSHAVWPPPGLVVFFAIAYGAMIGGIWSLESITPGAVVFSQMPEAVMVQRIFFAMLAGCYALFRLWRFHPACNRGYLAWLKSSPWTASKPLPLGPVHPVWQDAVVVGAIAALAQWNANVNPALPVAVFGLIYLGGMSLLLALTRTWMSCVILGFLWPAMILPRVEGLPMIVVVITIVGVIWHGHRTSLNAFPWQPMLVYTQSGGPHANPVFQIEVSSGNKRSNARTLTAIGWPWLALSPTFERASISTRTSIVVSGLIGWWLYCAMLGIDDFGSMSGMIFLLSLMAAGVRLAIYLSGLAPPLTVQGRFVSGSIFVPGFDHVFLTPLIVVLLSLAAEVIMKWSEAWHPEVASGFITLLLFVLLNGGPTLRTWLLTGQHRHRRPASVSVNRNKTGV